MAQVKLYRGGQATSLPNILQDGAVYLLDRGNNTGELYADVDNQRIKIGNGQTPIIVKTRAEWEAENPRTQSEAGIMYVTSDARSYEQDYEENGETLKRTVYVPGIKIGDGSSYVIDLPFINVTAEQINKWDNHVCCFLETELKPENQGGNKENLIFNYTFSFPE